MGPVAQMDAAVTTQARCVTVSLVAQRAAEGPLPKMHASVVAEGLGVPKQLPTLATAVSGLGAVNKLVALQVRALAETSATGETGEG